MKKAQKKTNVITDALVNLLINKQEICAIDFLENYPDMIVIVNVEDGKYLDTNKKTQEMCKKTNKELKKMTIYDTSENKWHKELDVFLKYARKYKNALTFMLTALFIKIIYYCGEFVRIAQLKRRFNNFFESKYS